MAFDYLQKIPEPDKIISQLPLEDGIARVKKERDREIKTVFTKESGRFLLIIGPCSAHDENAVCEYVTRLAALQERVNDSIIIVPRIYTNKPRTTGIGYKGMAHQPDPQEKPNIVEGIKAIRRMHIRALRESHLAAADEMLYPENYPYLEDVLSYVAIGARSVENQQHRLTVSGLDIPVGMKNPTSGDLDVMLNSVMAAQSSHRFSYNGWEVMTSGNPYAHCILRGAVNHYGQHISNYHYEDLVGLAETYLEKAFENPVIVVDTNHANSNKRYKEQPRIAYEVMNSRANSELLRDIVRGLMIESFLVEGSQDVAEGVYGKSITDPCLGWDDTERLVLGIAERL
ncbi:phospho-2-dehydro-3-deoxyheptonate aldolase, Phe-sensitive [bacterium BMS3Bbin06]|nr:phospho-2-dehydro-3-deoxyheptonate aldolase, Phe-sensitive [bacterium BMS3Abin08]GBE33639.1 phospho-2-dehydro-3-deoxyheptonate aldolase, Phe-sensitive [bacterium BMS3Bbin06]HDO35006.1 3-deoxy-7-phosphoheptulonate synthase [Nitrospirota bacterium]HDY71169.1 3-deoxy-7-phosphoheptulonate synthase [Nitrospirota bacterium]